MESSACSIAPAGLSDREPTGSTMDDIVVAARSVATPLVAQRCPSRRHPTRRSDAPLQPGPHRPGWEVCLAPGRQRPRYAVRLSLSSLLELEPDLANHTGAF